MMYYIESPSTDPHFNLALEQYVFDHLAQKRDCFMLWQNENAVIVGKHQNTLAELHPAEVKRHNIQVVRRLSGGGAVYHDLGNINFTFISEHTGSSFDFAAFCRPVVQALKSLGVPAELSGRNDMTIAGKKFSGNAQYVKHGRVMHHGTILFDSDLDMVNRVLNAPADKLISKGVQSVHSRVTNVKPYLSQPMSTRAFMMYLRDSMAGAYSLTPYQLSEADLQAVKFLQEVCYDTWAWNFGESPAFQLQKHRRVEGCGQITVHMDVENGVIQALAFYGDYFGSAPSEELAAALNGVRLEEDAIRAALQDVEIGSYFHSLDLDMFCVILLQ